MMHRLEHTLGRESDPLRHRHNYLEGNLRLGSRKTNSVNSLLHSVPEKYEKESIKAISKSERQAVGERKDRKEKGGEGKASLRSTFSHAEYQKHGERRSFRVYESLGLAS